MLGGCVGLLAMVADDVEDDRAAERRREAGDVELVSCQEDAIGNMAATVRVTNRSSKRSNYLIDVAFESADGREQLATAPVIVNALAPGQVAERVAATFEPAPEGFDCHVSEVERLSDEPS